MQIQLSEADWPVLLPSTEASNKDEKGRSDCQSEAKEKESQCTPPTFTYSSYQSTHRQEWHQCWETIAGMQHLTSLHVSIRYTLSQMFDDADACYDLLLPLLQLRGIEDLKFKLELMHSKFGNGRERRSVGFGAETKELVKKIKRTARLPRGMDLEQEEGEGEGDDEVKGEMYPRRECSCDLMPPVIFDYISGCYYQDFS
ncbi:MAG: hypothetical protein Q9180_008167 [Flavoplaca navasiana]